MRKVAGQLCRVSITAIPHPTQLKLVKSFLWDTLTIDWLDIEFEVDGETINLPNTVIIPLGAKFKVRNLMSQSFHVSMALCQGNTWYDLNSNTRAPIHRPLQGSVKSLNSPTIPFTTREFMNEASV